MKRYRWLVGSIVMTLLILSACQKNPQSYIRPVYPDYTFPGEVTASFPKPTEKGAKQLPDLAFHIDNKDMRIWNKTPLPYQAKFDSLDLRMKVTSEAVVRILNEQTKKTVIYDPRQANRIDMSGGKLRISIEIKDKPTIYYDFRIMTYGYNPNKYTWRKESATLPIAPEQAKVFNFNGTDYWAARVSDGAGKLYTHALGSTSFSPVVDAVLPANIIPTSLVEDSKKNVWAITSEGMLYKSSDMKVWNKHNTNTVVITELIGETTKMDGSIDFIAIGREGNVYSTYHVTQEGLNKENGELPKGFPVKDAFVYTYTFSNATSTTLYGGVTSDGKAAPSSFFLSGGAEWGDTPYQGKSQALPMSGGLFIPTVKDGELMVVGGNYPEQGDQNIIKRSDNRGVKWSTLPEQELPDGEFKARHNASGYSRGTGASLEIYILGGVINGVPSQEIWHGLLDTTGGIINSWEEK